EFILRPPHVPIIPSSSCIRPSRHNSNPNQNIYKNPKPSKSYFFILTKKMPDLAETYACVPATERGRGILISGSPKSNQILYTNGRSVLILNLDSPLEVSVYAEHAYPATVARFSPNGEWIASADVSGTVRIWGTRNEFV